MKGRFFSPSTIAGRTLDIRAVGPDTVINISTTLGYVDARLVDPEIITDNVVIHILDHARNPAGKMLEPPIGAVKPPLIVAPASPETGDKGSDKKTAAPVAPAPVVGSPSNAADQKKAWWKVW